MLGFDSQVIKYFNCMFKDLSRGGITNLVYIIIIDMQTGKMGYINGNGNKVLQAQVNAQEAARAALDAISKTTAEQIMDEADEDEDEEIADEEQGELDKDEGKDGKSEGNAEH